jgi:hypothetical protein
MAMPIMETVGPDEVLDRSRRRIILGAATGQADSFAAHLSTRVMAPVAVAKHRAIGEIPQFSPPSSSA